MTRGSALGALVFALLTTLGCMRKTTEIRVRDPGRVGVSALDERGLVPMLPADGLDRSANLVGGELGPRAVVFRQGPMVAVSWSASSVPLSVVDPGGLLPPQQPGHGVVMRAGWLYSKYELTPTRILPEGTPADYSVPLVVTTPVSNVAEATEVHEPRRWPAYVFLPVGGAFALIGGGLLVSSSKSDEVQLTGGTYLFLGVPLLIYGLINAFASPDYVPLDLAAGR